METKSIQDYLSQVLACDISFCPEELKALPFFIRKIFAFYSGELFSKKVYFLCAKDNFFDKHSIREIESSACVFNDKFQNVPVFVFDVLSRQERLMLIKRRISFIVPGTQMFLPYLGITLFERIKEKREPVSARLRPAAQAILIEDLLSGTINNCTLTQVAKFMNYTAMGIARAANQLEELKLCRIYSDGYRKTLVFDSDKRMLWERALPYLRSPVKKIVSIEDDTIFCDGSRLYAGEYALARYSNLAVSRKCYAVHEKTFRELLNGNHIVLSDSVGGGIADVQVWSYSIPRDKNDKSGTVDLLSLELSFQNTADPRIKAALFDIKENRQW
jgi:hypothetical protein